MWPPVVMKSDSPCHRELRPSPLPHPSLRPHLVSRRGEAGLATSCNHEKQTKQNTPSRLIPKIASLATQTRWLAGSPSFKPDEADFLEPGAQGRGGKGQQRPRLPQRGERWSRLRGEAGSRAVPRPVLGLRNRQISNLTRKEGVVIPASHTSRLKPREGTSLLQATQPAHPPPLASSPQGPRALTTRVGAEKADGMGQPGVVREGFLGEKAAFKGGLPPRASKRQSTSTAARPWGSSRAL